MINPEHKIVFIILSYLLGSISTSTIICQIKGINIRTIGSGNAGATNTLRALGKKYGIFVLILDFLKGLLPVLIARYIEPNSIVLSVSCAFSAVLGHVFPIFFSFKGGKGAATFIGAIFVIFPIGALICLITFIITLILFGFVGLSTICGAVSLPLSIYFLNQSDLVFFGISTMIFILISHLKNIIRLIQGNENKFYKIHIFSPQSIWRRKL